VRRGSAPAIHAADLDLLLADAAAFAARRQVQRQRRLARLGGALRREGVAAGAAAADGV